ncbi:MAG: hypothetical protein HS129_09150 [Leptospiraceae bacterium]|nr:hypothetical protein [Leptospiraceae bacterium]
MISKLVFLSTAFFFSIQCGVVQGNSASNSEEVAALAQTTALNSLNTNPNCGTVKGAVGKNSKFSGTLLANTASDIIQVNLGEETEVTIRAIPRSWDISLERINPANCEVLDTVNSFGNSGNEELKIVEISGIRNTVRIRSGDGSGSGDYTLEGF